MTEPSAPLSLAEKINFLFDKVRHPSGRKYTNSEVAAATGVSDTYVGYLRKGSADNPTLRFIQALARFFGVKPSFLTDDDVDDEAIARLDTQLQLFKAIRDPEVQALAMRASAANLSQAGLNAVKAMIDQVQLLEANLESGADADTSTGTASGDRKPGRGRSGRRPRTQR